MRVAKSRRSRPSTRTDAARRVSARKGRTTLRGGRKWARVVVGLAVTALVILVAGRLAAPRRPSAEPATRILTSSRLRRGGVLWLAFRVPILLYRLNLGWLFGHRMLLVTHRGRRTGQIRQTALEVVRYDAKSREAIVVSAWGERGDWYRNLRANPAVEVAIGSERYQPTQRFLTTDEIEAELTDYQRRHPLLMRVFGALLGFPVDGTVEARRRFAESVRMVAFCHPAES